MRLFYTLLVFGISLQIAAYLFWAFDVFGGLIKYPIDLVATTDWFSLKNFQWQFLMGVGGAVGIGLAMLLLRQGTYALYAILIWVMGVFLPFTSGFFLAIPNTIGALIPPDIWNMTNPLAHEENGIMVYPTHPLMVVIVLLFAFSAWIMMIELLTQRNIS